MTLKPSYDEKVQKYLRKQYDSVINPDINVQKQEKTKLYEQNRGKVRDKDEKD